MTIIKIFSNIKAKIRILIIKVLIHAATFCYRSADFFSKFKVTRIFLDTFCHLHFSKITKATCGDYEFVFSTPNQTCIQRALNFKNKEPETINFINTMERGSVFWDIGANVGVFSIYAAKVRQCRVFSFEPSVFNLGLLARNIWLNSLTDQITIVPLPLTDRIMINKLHLSTTEEGGAVSTFGESITYDGTSLNSIFEYSTIGISADESVRFLHIPLPEYLKIDADGIEHYILRGSSKILDNIKGLIIEVDEHYVEKNEIVNRVLEEKDFCLESKYAKTLNQIWRKRNKDEH